MSSSIPTGGIPRWVIPGSSTRAAPRAFGSGKKERRHHFDNADNLTATFDIVADGEGLRILLKDIHRWPELLFALGALLIMGEIILAEVLLSQIGNILIFLAGVAFAWLLLRDRTLT